MYFKPGFAAVAMAAISAMALVGCSEDGRHAGSSALPASDNPVEAAPAMQQSPPSEFFETPRPFFGELHVHTQNSFDAYTFGVRSTPEDAYRYARGEAIDHVSGEKIQAKQPLDFMSITDHAEYLGLWPELIKPGGQFSSTDIAKEIFSGDKQRARAAMTKVVYTISSNPPTAIEELVPTEFRRTKWQEYVELADRYYQPGVFTTLVGFEWTLIPDSKNLHRNVIFKGTNVPAIPFSAFDSDKPEELWQWLDQARASGSDVMAIPHNSNISDGLMFQLQDSWGNPIDRAYAEARLRNEPLVEITQIKGSSETHPVLSPNDEWADFEILEEVLGGSRKSKIHGGYVREAYLNGLKMESGQGFNPYQFGVIGASDSHNSSVPVEEDNYTGKVGHTDGTAKARLERSALVSSGLHYSASGLAGVWAQSNTREAIFDAMQRKEVFGTSGPRISVLLFAGEFPAQLPSAGLPLADLYKIAVPMGATITASDEAPRLYAWAMRDANNAPLQRLQIVKGWVTSEGDQKEAVFDIACSDGGQPDPSGHRCPDNGATVDTSTCAIEEHTGAQQLTAVWQDPQFELGQYAFYYVRVLENPTCRWSSWDALRNGWALPDSVPATLQERAWTSPIWVKPGKG